MSECCAIGCERDATHYLLVTVPMAGQGMEITYRRALLSGYCRDHAESRSDLVGLEGDIAAALDVNGLIKPDPARAKAEVRRIGDKPWMQTVIEQSRGKVSLQDYRDRVTKKAIAKRKRKDLVENDFKVDMRVRMRIGK